jgi:hypothetical protein
MAEAAATKPIQIDPADAEVTFKTVGSPLAGWFSAKPMFDVMAEECENKYLL